MIVDKTTSSGRNKSNPPVVLDYSSNTITSSSWFEIVASMASDATHLHIFDSSGYPLQIGFGDLGQEVVRFVVSPGGDGPIALRVPAGTRLTIKSVSETLTVGILIINFLK